ncbi:MAG: FAD-linked oxidase C-terminal domain-containing protein [Acidobacteriota bacterium]
MTSLASGERRAGIDAAVSQLADLFGDRLSRSPSILDIHGRDESWHGTLPPDAVFFPESTDEVARAVRVCAEHRCPVIPWGAGTSVEGHTAPLHGGVTFDLSGLDRILEVNADDLDCRVGAGVKRKQLERALYDLGLFFPIDPGADATFGGMASTRASGTTAVRYGTFRDAVLGLTVVLADGQVIRTGTRARKSSAGYDLTRLFVGAEGTLGILTEVQLRLWGRPDKIVAAVCPFGSLAGAVETAMEVVQLAIPVARIELLDAAMVDAVNRYSDRSDPVQPTLFFELHGSPGAVAEQTEMLREITASHGGGDFAWSGEQAEREALWHARHHALYASLALRPGCKAFSTDVCVPISRLGDVLPESQADARSEGLLAPIVGHVGDGNFHMILIFDPDDRGERATVERVNERLVERALAAGGTSTGEHGVGFGKIEWVEREHGDAVDVMRRIRRALDPDQILNPGKIFRG